MSTNTVNSTTLKIQDIQSSEITSVSSLIASGFSQLIAPGYDAEGIKVFNQFIQPDQIAERIATGKHFILTASENGSLVGAIEIRDYSHICLFFVRPDLLGKGIGKKLFQEASRRCLANGSSRIDVNSSPYALKIYENLGFQATGPETTRSGIRFIPMEAALQAFQNKQNPDSPVTIEDINYSLPDELIADKPAGKREESRLLTVNRNNGALEDRSFYEIEQLLNPGDCLVFNDTRVFKARIYGHWKQKKTEILLVERINDREWKAAVRNSRKIADGDIIEFDGISIEVLEIGEDHLRRVRFSQPIDFEMINQIGTTPLPPYIVSRRKSLQLPAYVQEDDERYQSVMAKYYGSVAAPTASLHFSDGLVERLKAKGVRFATITLHVGPGTFKPIQESIETFEIHREWLEVGAETVHTLQDVKAQGKRIIAVGTTAVRSLETMASGTHSPHEWQPYSGFTQLFIKNQYTFQVIDAMITNFHMPMSTLLLLVYSFGGKANILKAYRHAIEEKYRFLSYGDGMFIY